MKYLMGFLLCFSFLVNIAYTYREEDYILIVENSRNDRSVVKFKSCTEPVVVGSLGKRDSLENMFATRRRYYYINGDSTDYLRVYCEKE